MDIFKLPVSVVLTAAVFLGGCGRSDELEASFPPRDISAEVQEYYKTFKRVPPDLQAKLNSGEINQEQFDAAMEEVPLFFSFKTPADIPENLNWEDGSDLPEFASPNAKKGGTLRGSISDFPRTLRPLGPDANGSFRPYIVDDIYVRLAPRHPNDTSITETGFKHYPGLAREWAVDRENRTVYVRLFPDARWSDGEPVTSDDMLFTFFFHQSPHIMAPWYNNWYTQNYTNVTKYDDHTFSIQVAEARPDMDFKVLELYPVPEHFYKELGPDYVQRYQWRPQPTTGAYVVLPADIRKGRSITLTRQQDWWAKDKPFWRNRFNYDRIHLEVVRDPDKTFESFLRGDYDGSGLVQLPEYWYDKLPDRHDLVQGGYIHKVTFYNDVPRPTYGLWINQAGNPLLANRDIRIGLQYATNWDRVIEQYFRGDATRMNTTAPGYGEFEHPSLKARPFNVEKALEHFAAAGFTKRGADGILVNENGQRLSFTITTGYRTFSSMLTILQEEARKAGVDFSLDIQEATAAWKKAQEKKHEITFSAFGVSPEMYPRYWETYHSFNAYDQAFLKDGVTPNPNRQLKVQTNNLLSMAYPQMDRWIEAYDTSTDVEEMKRLAFQMEEFMHQEAVWVPGFVIPFYRVAHWRWLNYPEDFNLKISQAAGEHYVGWIDEEMRKETLDAMRSGKTFEPVIRVFDQYKRD